nr:oligosaccharide flippase family protein [Myroides odoratimimus]
MSYLTILQLINIIIPLLTYPYIIRVLGVDNYGLIVYSQAIIGYIVLLISFGFNITATKDISRNRLNVRKLSKIVSSVFVIKFSIFIISLVILMLIVVGFALDSKLSNLLILTMWMGFYEVFFPVFYFHGTEKMKFITLLNFISKILFLILVFAFIKNSEDVYLYPVFNGLTGLIVCILSIKIVLKHGVKLYFPKFSILTYYIRKSYVMALAYASNNLKSGLNIILIKLLFGVKEVAYFDLAMKIITMGNTFSDVLNQAVFPKISREKNMIFLKKVLVVILFSTSLFVIFTFLFGEWIVRILGGVNMSNAVLVLKIVSFVVPFYAVGGLLGRNCLIVFNKDKIVLRSMIVSGILYLFLVLIYYMCRWENLEIFSMFFLVSFMFETLYRYYYCKKEKLI